MSRSTVYYDIFERGEHLEYHCSHIREEVVNRESMSRRIKKDHPEANDAKDRWFAEVNSGMIDMERITGDNSFIS